MVRTTIAIGLAAMVGACGGGSPPAGNTSGDSGSSGTSSATRSATAGSVTALTGGVQGSNDCSKNPDFAAVYAGGTISVCSSAHFDATHKTSGSFSYATSVAPATVLAWSKEQAAKAGMPVRMSSAGMLSVGEADKRMMVVFARPEGSGSKVTVNWTNPD